MVRLNLSLDDIRNWQNDDGKTTIVNERNPQFGVQTRTFIWKSSNGLTNLQQVKLVKY